MEDVLTVIPFRNTIDIIEIRGNNLIQVFERSVSNYDSEQLDGAFLQVSGKPHFNTIHNLIMLKYSKNI